MRQLLVVAVIVCFAAPLGAQQPQVPYHPNRVPGRYSPYAPYSYGNFPAYGFRDYARPSNPAWNAPDYSPHRPTYDPYYHTEAAPAPVERSINVNREQYFKNPRYRQHIDKLEAQGYVVKRWY